MSFDLAAYKRAVEAKDVAAWLACYAECAGPHRHGVVVGSRL